MLLSPASYTQQHPETQRGYFPQARKGVSQNTGLSSWAEGRGRGDSGPVLERGHEGPKRRDLAPEVASHECAQGESLGET